jgi:hypothetical protein
MGYTIPLRNLPNGYAGLDGDGNLRVNGVIVRAETAAAMASILLAAGELGFETDSKLFKVGDGATLGGRALAELASPSTVVVRATGTPTQNGDALKAAYTAAKTLTPNGSALSASNRAAVLVGPGVYDFGASAMYMNAQYVDLIGLGRENVLITSSDSTIILSGDDVLIRELTLQSTYTGGSDKFALYVYTNRAKNKLHRVRLRGVNNGQTIRTWQIYAGQYSDVIGDNDAGTYITLFQGTCSGTFINCTGGNSSFDGPDGTLVNCVGGDSSFGTIYANARLYFCNGKGPSAFNYKESGAKAFFCIKNDAQYSGND